MRRHRLGRRHSEAMFTRNALRVHPMNTIASGPRRGGIRL